MTQIKQKDLNWSSPVQTFEWPGVQIPVNLN